METYSFDPNITFTVEPLRVVAKDYLYGAKSQLGLDKGFFRNSGFYNPILLSLGGLRLMKGADQTTLINTFFSPIGEFGKFGSNIQFGIPTSLSRSDLEFFQEAGDIVAAINEEGLPPLPNAETIAARYAKWSTEMQTLAQVITDTGSSDSKKITELFTLHTLPSTLRAFDLFVQGAWLDYPQDRLPLDMPDNLQTAVTMAKAISHSEVTDGQRYTWAEYYPFHISTYGDIDPESVLELLFPGSNSYIRNDFLQLGQTIKPTTDGSQVVHRECDVLIGRSYFVQK